MHPQRSRRTSSSRSRLCPVFRRRVHLVHGLDQSVVVITGIRIGVADCRQRRPESSLEIQQVGGVTIAVNAAALEEIDHHLMDDVRIAAELQRVPSLVLEKTSLSWVRCSSGSAARGRAFGMPKVRAPIPTTGRGVGPAVSRSRRTGRGIHLRWRCRSVSSIPHRNRSW